MPFPREVAQCVQCGGDIYDGDEVARIYDEGEAFVHNGWGYRCAKEYAMERTYDAIGVIDTKLDVN